MADLSQCVGSYDSQDEACEATDNGQECTFRRRCAAFTRYLRKNKKNTDQFIRTKAANGNHTVAYAKHGYDKFCEFCDRLVDVEAAKDEAKDKNRDKRADGPTPRAIKASKTARAKMATEQRATLMVMFKEFQKSLVKELDGAREFGTAGNIVTPGQLYAIDRTANPTSCYVAVYCRASTGKDVALIKLRLRPRFLAFDVYLHQSLEVLKKSMGRKNYKKLNPQEAPKAGVYNTVIKGAKRREISLLAEVVAGWVRDGIIVIPDGGMR